MKCFLLISAFALLFSQRIIADDIFINTGNKASGKTEITLISSDNFKTVINLKLNGLYNKKVKTGGAEYDNVYLKDFVSLGNLGQAALPAITKLISIPNYKNAKVIINYTKSQVIESYNILPYQAPPLRNTSGISNSFEIDNSYYSSNKNYPENIVSIKEIAVLRDFRIAVVTINPVQYNPIQKRLTVYSDINFELKYEGYSNVNNVSYQSHEISNSFRNIYKNVIFNYTNDNSFTAAPSMLVIIADSLESSIIPYINWKNKKGIRTVLIRKSALAGTNEPTSQQIKDYLTTQYNSNDRPEYVLLVGDARGNNTIPWFDAAGGKSDHPYECLDGTDILPDIVVGRISVQSQAELDIAVTKFIQYEKQPNMAETDWYKRAFVLHSNDGIDPINAQVAKNVFLNEGGFTNVDIASPITSQSQITNFINGGVSWIWFIGHGSETSWANPVWNMSNMVNLNFGRKQPNIVSIACSNADLDYSQTSDCFGEAWIERSPENSATNIAASTELCAFYTTDTLGREMLYAYFRHGIYDFGSMLNYGKIQAYNYFNGNNTVTETINQFMVLGDPTMESYSDIPKILNVSSSSNSSQYKINVKSGGLNIEGALVAVNQNNELKISGYTDNTGDYTFDAVNIQNGIPVNVVATGKNFAPYDGDLILTSLNNISEIPNIFSLSQNYPNPFNPKTIINYEIPSNMKNQMSNVKLTVYNTLGKETATLVNENKDAGNYQIEFDGSNLPSGIYFYKLTAGEFSEVKKMTLLK